MNPQRPLVLLLAIGVLALRSTAAERPLLTYDFSTARTNGYRITAHVVSDSTEVTHSGPIIVGIKPGDDSGTLMLHAQLNLRRQVRPGPPGMPMHHMGHPFGSLHNPWLAPRHLMAGPQSPEAQVDAHGRPLRQPRHLDLPNPAESFLSLLYPRLPDGGATEATFQGEFIVEENAGMPSHMHFAHPGGPGNNRLPGTRTERIKLTRAANDTIRLERELEFGSFAKTGDAPRLAYNLKGVYTFEAEGATLQSAELEGSVTYNTLEFAQDLPVDIKLERLTEEEYQKALENIPALQPRVLDDDSFANRVAEITGQDVELRRKTAQRLASIEISTERAEKYRETFLPLLEDPENMVRAVATRILAATATPEDVPLLLKLISGEDTTGRHHELMAALGRLKDERALEPLAELIAQGLPQSHSAAHALGDFGAAAEDTALKLLGEKHAETRRQACEILMRVGTEKSLEHLQKLDKKRDHFLDHQVNTAIRMIRDRIEGPAQHEEHFPVPDALLDPNILL